MESTDEVKKESDNVEKPQKKKDVTEDAILSAVIHSEDLGPSLKAIFERGIQSSFLDTLETFIQKKDREIEELCNANFQEFIRSVDELLTVRQDVADLRDSIRDINDKAQSAATKVISTSSSLVSFRRVRANMSLALQLLIETLNILSSIITAADNIAAGNYFPALKTLYEVQRVHMMSVSPSRLTIQLGNKVPAMIADIKRIVTNRFNDWLLTVRETCGQLGKAGMDHVAAQQERDANARLEAADPKQQMANELVLDPEAVVEEVGLDVSPVYECLHIYDTMGLREEFKTYYKNNRRIQANLCVEIPKGNRLSDVHQLLFSQVAGYFIVEHTMVNSSPDLISQPEVDSVWELVVGKLVAALGEDAASATAATTMMAVKSSALLFCSTMQAYGYNAATLLDALDGTASSYLNLLVKQLQPRVTQVLQSDPLAPTVLADLEAYNKVVVQRSLILDPTNPPPDKYPFEAAFSAGVPQLWDLAHDSLPDIVNYARGLSDTHHGIRKGLDWILVHGVNEPLQQCLTDSLPLYVAIQLSVNAHYLSASCVALDKAAFALSTSLTYDERASCLSAVGTFLSTKARAEWLIYDKVHADVEAFISSAATQVNWLPLISPKEPSPYMKDLVQHLSTQLTRTRLLPESVRDAVYFAACTHVTNSIMEMLAGPSIKRFNTNAMEQLELDVNCVEQWAAATPVHHLTDAFIQLRQLIKLFKNDFYVEAILDANKRAMFFSQLSLQRLIPILDKYRETGIKVIKSKLSTVSIESVVKKLKEINHREST